MTKPQFFYALFLLGMFFGVAGIQSCKQPTEEEVINSVDSTTTVVDGDFTTISKDTTFANSVVIKYSGTSATVTNTMESAGVKVSVTNGNVVVTSTTTSTEVNYVVTGSATNGSLKIYSDYKFNLVLNGVSLINSTGPAINIQSGKKVTVNVLSGTNNRLVDGSNYATSSEDQKGTLFSEGQLSFEGSGALSITANNKHAIASDDYVAIKSGTITVTKTVSDGIHANDYFKMEGGTLNITSASDGIDCEEGYINISGGNITINSVDDGITTSYEGTDTAITPYISITGGTINVTTTGEKGNAIKSVSYTTIETSDAITLSVSGKGAKGIKTNGDFTLSAGTLKITTSGAAYYNTTDADIAAPSGINCDKNLIINGGTLIVSSTGVGGKGVTVDGTATINGGTSTITTTGATFTYNSATTSEAKGFKCDGAFVMNKGELTISATNDGLKSGTSITVNDGTINVTKSYEAMESILITIAGGVCNLTATNDGINTSYGTVSGGTESNDNSHLKITGGVLIVTGSDAIDSNGNFIISGGVVISNGDEDIDVNGNFLVNGGTLIGAEPASNMTKAMSTASSQVSFFIKSNSSISTSSLLHIEDASGKELATFTPKVSSSYFHFSHPSLAKENQYKIYYGGTYTGGSLVGNASGWGLHTGGTYSSTGATLKSSPTTSSSSTVNTITF